MFKDYVRERVEINNHISIIKSANKWNAWTIHTFIWIRKTKNEKWWGARQTSSLVFCWFKIQVLFWQKRVVSSSSLIKLNIQGEGLHVVEEAVEDVLLGLTPSIRRYNLNFSLIYVVEITEPFISVFKILIDKKLFSTLEVPLIHNVGANGVTHVVCARADIVATGIILSFSFFFFFPSTYFSSRRGLPRKLKFGGWPNLTLTRRFSQKKNGVRDPPPNRHIWADRRHMSLFWGMLKRNGVRALWESEDLLWRIWYSYNDHWIVYIVLRKIKS